jgi:hypothetical protein
VLYHLFLGVSGQSLIYGQHRVTLIPDSLNSFNVLLPTGHAYSYEAVHHNDVTGVLKRSNDEADRTDSDDGAHRYIEARGIHLAADSDPNRKRDSHNSSSQSSSKKSLVRPLTGGGEGDQLHRTCQQKNSCVRDDETFTRNS